MVKKPKHKAMLILATEAIRNNPIKSVTAVFVLLASMSGTIAGADHLLWVTPAPIAYVDKTVRIAGDVIQLDLANGKREASQRAIDDLEFKELQASSPEQKLKIQQIKRREQQTYDALTDQIKTLKSQHK